MRIGDKIGVVDFDHIVTVTYPLTEIHQDGIEKTLAKNAIDSLYARGATSIGGGLQAGQNQLNTRGLDSLGNEDPVHVMVLLSDGGENTAPFVADVLPGIVADEIVVHTVGLVSGDSHAIFTAYAPQDQYLVSAAKVAFGFDGSHYRVQAGVLCDGGYFCYVTPLVSLSDDPHMIEIEWWAASGPGAEDGGLKLWVDGEQQAEITGVDNDTHLIESARLGAMSGIEASTYGSEYFDAFESYRSSAGGESLGGSRVLSDSESLAGVEVKGYRTSAGEALEEFLIVEIIPLD